MVYANFQFALKSVAFQYLSADNHLGDQYHDYFQKEYQPSYVISPFLNSFLRFFSPNLFQRGV